MAGETMGAQDRNAEDQVVERIGILENRVVGRLNSISSTNEIRIVGVEMSFGELFKIFFKAMPAYLLAMFVWMMLIGVVFGLLVAAFGLSLLGIFS